MSDITRETAVKSVDHISQLAEAMSQFRRSLDASADRAAKLNLHRAAGLMEVVIHDLNSVAADLAQAFEVVHQPAATDWPDLNSGGHGHGHSCGCGCDNH